MITKRKYTDVTSPDNFSVDDYWALGDYLFYLKDDFLHIRNADSEEIFESERLFGLIENNNPELLFSKTEEFVHITGWKADPYGEKEAMEKDSTGGDWHRFSYRYLYLVSNYGTTATFKLKINQSYAELSFFRIDEIAKTRAISISDEAIISPDCMGVSGSLSQSAGFNITDISSNSIKHTEIELVNNDGELPAVKNYFGNISNYALAGWGGFGGMKDGIKITDFIKQLNSKTIRQQLILAYYSVGSFLDNYYEIRATMPRGKGKHIKIQNEGEKREAGEIVFPLDSGSSFVIVPLDIKTESEIFDIVYRGDEHYLFIPSKVRAKVEDDSLIFNNLQRVITRSYGLVYEIAPAKIEENNDGV